MKKIICILCVISLAFCVCACSGDTANRTGQSKSKTVADVLSENTASSEGGDPKTPTGYVPDGDLSGEKCDVDLTVMNSTLVYAEVSNMMSNPGNYRGKTVKMQGKFSVYETEARSYYACIIADATACCSQGIEFVLVNQRKYPDEYPQLGTEITVVGRFETYKEGTTMYCQLSDARIS